MSGYEPYQSLQYAGFSADAPEAVPNSKVGIASFIIAVVSGSMIAIVIAVLATLVANERNGLDAQPTSAVTLGCTLFVAMGLNFLGVVLGVIGLFQSRKRVFAAVGTTSTGSCCS